ncbi:MULTISPECIES: non-ribosomal peptide synthetase [unclassified Brenneria]|uniref:non-ribosomal peptide synthetase n=1 Tax=unclassified Brenneria TaxID=2634434 RepID=UPI001554AD7E|nr:non-ribosomal peptide synthetase [Brenneria sp. HEZEL_4_2_4]NPD00308.1 amino acid adenylation domain-containing protein [Brenneria sp. hezel4-2-4]
MSEQEIFFRNTQNNSYKHAFPLSAAQRGIWFAQHLNPSAKAKVFKIAEYFEISGSLDPKIFETAVRRTVAETESLRITLKNEAQGPRQYVGVTPDWAFPIVDLRGNADPDGAAAKWMQADLDKPYEPQCGRLFSFALIQTAAERFFFYHCDHHLITDGYGSALFVRRLAEVYSALVANHEPPACTFVGLADALDADSDYETSSLAQRDRRYWMDLLADRPAPVSLAGRQAVCSDIVRQQQYLPARTDDLLRRVARQHDATLPQLLITLIAIYLYRMTGQDDLLLGLPVTARSNRKLRRFPGMVSNVLPLRLKLASAATLVDCLRQTESHVYGATRHQRYRGEALNAELDLMAGRGMLFATAINIIPLQYDQLSFGGYGATVHNLALGPTDDLSITVLDRGPGGGLELCLSGNAALYGSDDMDWHFRRLAHFFAATADNQDKQIGDYALLLPDELALLRQWNAMQTVYASPDCIHQRFERQARVRPDAVAVVYEDCQLSYGELNGKANQLAHWLVEQGVRPDSRVAIALARGCDLLVAILATLKAGGAYVPLDPGYPQERLRYVLQDSAPDALITTQTIRPLLGDLPDHLSLVALDDDSQPWARCSAADIAAAALGLTARHLAYIIYTSGSTGQPKGVMVEHRNVTRLLASTQYWFHFDPQDTWTLFHSYAFDFSVWEIWGALLHGARLVVVPQSATRSPQDFYRLLCRQKVTVLNQTPSVFRQLIAAQAESRDAHCLRYVIFGGEALEVATLAPWYRQNADSVTQLINMYGITETTVHATYRSLDAADVTLAGESPIGRPLPDLRVYILDAQGNPLPLGVVGELYVAGAGVTRGYLNRPQLTAERFLPDPFADEADARMYKSGDLGRWLADGTIEYLGRNDFQVKIRGYRIELGEIESALLACDGVREAVVAAVSAPSQTQDKRLVAYYVADGEHNLSVETLKTQLGARLPEYMVPAAYVALDNIPLTANGKVDRKALPAPDEAAFVRQVYEAPQSADEQALAALWRSLLGVDKVGRHDSFFALGGHSLLAVQLISRVRTELDRELTLATLFARPALSDLAAALEEARQGSLPAIVPQPDGETPPLSLAQQRLWFLAQMDEAASAAYVIAGDVRMLGKLDVAALQQALDRIVARHAALRTHIENRNGVPVQVIEAEERGFPLSRIDMDGENGDLAPFAPTFDLTTGPLAQGQLVRVNAQEHRLRLAMHHIIADGWSLGVFMREFSALYGALSQDQNDPLPTLSIQYGDYAAWQHQHLRGEVLHSQRQYWVEQLRGAPDCLTLPTDRPRPQTQSYAGAGVSVTLDKTLTKDLNALSQRHGCTLFMTLLAGWGALMGRLSGQDDIVMGSPIAGRNRREIEPLIGMFVNTLALRIDLSEQPDTDALLAQVKATALAAQSHADIPFEQVVEALSPTRSLSHSPLFQVMLALQNTAGNALELPGLTLSIHAGEITTSQFDLSLDLQEVAGQLEGTLYYATALFDENTVRSYLDYWQRLLRGMAAAPHQPVRALPILSAAERQRVLVDVNNTAMAYLPECCLHTLFEAQAAQQPEALALICDDRRLSYSELNARANQLAHWLIEQGVRPDSRVAIVLERSSELIVAMLATLKAGGAYVPLDPGVPPERLAYMVADSAPQVMIASRATRTRLGALPPETQLIAIDAGACPWADCARDNIAPPRLGLTPRHLAYIIYTSGSTGQPKGVMVEHRGVVNLVRWHCQAFGLRAQDAASCVAGLGFDAAVWEIWPPLSVGARLLLPSPAVSRDPGQLLDWWAAQPINVGFLPTPVAELAFARGLNHPTLRTLLVGGDRLNRRPAEGANFTLVNNYGPTENTVVATSGRICAADRVLHIGRPIANTRTYILDAEGQPAPMGVSGELYIGGAQVARGYLNRADLTAERFLPDPFADEADARMYKTGDLGRWLADGAIEYLGRNDFQVKIRGFRIELGEIESALLACEGVSGAVVTVSGEEKRLVAYYTADDATQATSIEGLKAQLGVRLPEYMVPAAYVRLERIPLTPNGKVDRKALPAPDEAAFIRQAYEAPQGADEQALAALWQSLLGLDKVGRHDNFFALGGHSLLAVQLISRVRTELDRELTLATLFARPALSELAAALGEARQGSLPAIVPQPDGETPPLSLAQQRLWFLAQMDEAASAAYVIAGGVRMLGKLDAAALQRALDRIVARHAALRTHIENRHGVPVQAIEAEDRGFPLSRIDINGESSDLAPFAPRFDLTTGPLAQGQLVRVNAQEHWLRLAMHHIIADGWSIGVFMRELSALYDAFSQNQSDPLPALSIQYGDYAAWQHQHLRGKALQAQQQYWTEQLRGAPDCLTLPTDRPRPAVQNYAGAHMAITLDKALTKDLNALSQRHGCTLFMTLLAGWAALMGRLSGQDDIVMGSPIAGRNRREIEPLIGMFVNTQALRVDLSGQPDTDALLAQVKATALAAQSHADIPFEQVVEALSPTRSLSYSPLFQVMLALHNMPDNAFELPGLRLSPLPNETATCQFDLNLELRETNGQLAGTLYYATALFDAGTVRRYLDYWQSLLRGMAAAPRQPVRALPILSAAERQQVLVDFNNTAAAYPSECCLPALFEARVVQQPDAVAVVCEERRLSYGELNARANQLAHWLIAQGIRPDDRVAICMARSLNMVVALLGILKAGGAYVPLDPIYPRERLAYMLKDSAPMAVLIDGMGRSVLAGCCAMPPAFDLEADAARWADQPAGDPDPRAIGLTPQHLAYVIYTSGSTGRPKGIAMPHAPLVNLIHWQNRRPTVSTLQFASFGFDVAFQEMLSSLAGGGVLEMVASETRLDMTRLARFLNDRSIARAFIPPALLQALAREKQEQQPALPIAEVITSGETLRASAEIRALFAGSPQSRLHNQYGPAETHVTTEYICPEAVSDWSALPSIGRPIANARIYILDAQGEPVPIGVAGEIHIGGVGLARGYLNLPELTAERFLPDPFADRPQARMYKTGDLGRWLADGAIDYLGRNDFQVKIRGFRIEPGEIETCMRAHQGVEEALVVAREATAGETRLVAYYQGPAGVDALRAHVADRLPDYMVPSAWVSLAAFPLTPNGKVNRQALPEPDDSAFARMAYQAPEGEMEQAIAVIWQSLLNVDRLGRHDNFFALGGHSLLAVQLISRIRLELEVEVPLAELFAYPSLSAFSERVVDISIEQFDITDLLEIAGSLEGENHA